MMIFRSGVLDNTSGFRMYRRWILARISSSRLRFQGFPYLLEVMVRASEHGARVAKVPTEYEHRHSGSKFGTLEMLQYIAAVFYLLFRR